MTERILILVKTYPTISEKYDELVCTAGIRENGEWVRIYPVPFRYLEWPNRYKKFQWVRVKLEKTSDPRPESFRPMSDIEPLGEGAIDTKNDWAERRKILSAVPVHDNLEHLIDEAKENKLSLAVFKPAKIEKFIAEETSREWSPDKLRILERRAKQSSLFQDADELKKEFKLAKKLPYKFFYHWHDKVGKKSTMMIEDWEIGALFWNCLRGQSEKSALEKVRQKYEHELPQKDLHLILGTTRQFHGWAKNPFIIVGLYYPPHQKRTML